MTDEQAATAEPGPIMETRGHIKSAGLAVEWDVTVPADQNGDPSGVRVRLTGSTEGQPWRVEADLPTQHLLGFLRTLGRIGKNPEVQGGLQQLAALADELVESPLAPEPPTPSPDASKYIDAGKAADYDLDAELANGQIKTVQDFRERWTALFARHRERIAAEPAAPVPVEPPAPSPDAAPAPEAPATTAEGA